MTESTIQCGCGFAVTSPDSRFNLEALRAHDCPNAYIESSGDRWYHHVFSRYGVVIVLLACSALYAIFGHGGR